MKRLIWLVLGMSFLTFVACQQNTDPVEQENEDVAAIKTILEDSSDLMFDGLDEEDENNIEGDDPDGAGLEKNGVRTRFVRIRRHPVERSIQVTLDPGDTTATAYVYTKFKGILRVKKVEFTDTTWSFDWYDKPITHSVERIVHLKKVDETGNLRKDWKILEISMKNGYSQEPGVEILELVIKPDGQDSTVISDPLEYFQDGVNLFTFPRLTEVYLRVTVKNTTSNPVYYPEDTQATETVLLHYGRNPRYARAHFGRSWFTYAGQDAQGNNVYEGTWTVQQIRGLHHAVIDVIDNGTILEKSNDDYPYVSATWAGLYRVTPF